MGYRIFLLIFVAVLPIGHGRAQGQENLDSLEDKISHHVATEMPGWAHKRGEPIQGSKNVLVEFWQFSNRVVKISIVPQKSSEEAREKMQSFLRNTKEAEPLKGFGDESYSWGYAGSNVIFRRGKIVVFVSTVVDVDEDPDAQILSQSEKAERAKSEMKRLSKEFAKHVASAMDLP
jgi:hypothetical protein